MDQLGVEVGIDGLDAFQLIEDAGDGARAAYVMSLLGINR